MKNKTKEEAYLEMLKPAKTITFKVQNSGDKLSAIKDSHGDGFYIRSLNYSLFFLIQLPHSQPFCIFCSFTVE